MDGVDAEVRDRIERLKTIDDFIAAHERGHVKRG